MFVLTDKRLHEIISMVRFRKYDYKAENPVRIVIGHRAVTIKKRSGLLEILFDRLKRLMSNPRLAANKL